MSRSIGEPGRVSGGAIAQVTITTLIAAGLPLAFALLAPVSARAWGGVVLLGLLGYAAIRSGWAWLMPFVGAVVLLPILLDLSAWQPGYTYGSIALGVGAAALVIGMTVRGMSRRPVVASPPIAIAAPMDSVASPHVLTASPMGSALIAPSASVPVAPSTIIASQSVPDAPQSDIPIVVSLDGSVTLTWASPREDGGAPVEDYAVEVSSDNGITWAPVRREVSAACTALVENLEFGVPHAFRVAAVNAAGRGAFSGATATIIPIGPPGAPHSVVSTPGDRHVTVQWQPPSDTAGSPITSYRVEVSGDGGATWSAVKGSAAPDLSRLVPHLANGTAYVLRVVARNAAGEGPPSEPSAVVRPAGPPSAPGPITAIPVVGGFDVTWSPPAKDGGMPITGYLIEVSANNGVTWESVADAAECAVTVTGLASGIGYLIRVSARNAVCPGTAAVAARPLSPIGVPGIVPSVVAHFASGSTARMLPSAVPVATSPPVSAPMAPPPPVVLAGPAGAAGAAETSSAITLSSVIEPPGRPRHAARWVVGSALIIIGVIAVGVIAVTIAARTTIWADRAFDLGQLDLGVLSPASNASRVPPSGDERDGSPVITTQEPSAPVGDPGMESAPESPPLPVPIGAVIGTIAFERGGEAVVVDTPLVVRQGVGDAELALGPGHYPRTALPGDAGNAAIAGHRTGWGSPFLHLDDLQVGDAVVFTDADGNVRRFSVHTTAVVKPDEAWVLGPDPVSVNAPTLTLTTCDPPHVNSRRLVVFAVLDPQT